MSELQIFDNTEFGSVRTILIKGEPYFVGKDVADILEYQNGSRDINRHVDEEDRSKLMLFDGSQDKETIVINESGLYSLIMSSKLPMAKKFKRWVTSEVLPAMRKHGVYALDEMLANPDVLIQALTKLKQEREINQELTQRNLIQRQQIAELQPKASYYDLILQSKSVVPITQIAKDYGMSGRKFNELLYRLRVQYKHRKTWFLYQAYINVDGEMVIVPEQAEVVKQIFADTLAGKSTHTIADELNERGIKGKRGGKWAATSINAIICNEKYTGDALFQKTYTDDQFNRHINHGEHDQYLYKEHHEPIINYEIFNKAKLVLKQRGKEKGNGVNTERYQNRYAFSGKINCGECGGGFKRVKHSKASEDYIAWSCTKHIEDKSFCSMKYVKDDFIKAAFLTMMNKLAYAHGEVLKPLLHSLQGYDDKDKLLQIQKLEMLLEKNTGQKQMLTTLMASGFLEPALFSKENNALLVEEQYLQEEKRKIMLSVSGDRTKVIALEELLKTVAYAKMMTEFDDSIFLTHVERIIVLSREEVIFEMKCGLKLRERLLRL